MSPSPAEGATLPVWPAGTVLVLVTAGADPHAIPISAAVRADARHVLLGLARSRESLRRLRADPRVALSITAGGDVAVTAYGVARVREEHLVDGVAAVELEVERVQDHNRPTLVIESGIVWHWVDADAENRDGDVRTALGRLTSGARSGAVA